MKKLTLFTTIFVAVVTIAACDRRPAAYSKPPVLQAASPPQPNPEIAARAMADFEKRVQVEHELRLATETRLQEQESAKSHWQTLAMLAATAAIVLLIVGAILGTRARHDAKK